MDNANQPSPPRASNEALPAIEARLSVLENKIAGQSGDFATADLDADALGPAELSTELERYRDQLRDYEKALVERIADVDDDRRATESRLQRAWQTQREEIDERLRRFAGLMLGLLGLFIVLVIVALFLGYRYAVVGQPDVAGQLTELRQELSQLSGKGAVSAQLREKLEQLTGQVGEIASSVERLNMQGASQPVVAEGAAHEEAEAAVNGEIRRLDMEQKRLAQALASLELVVDDVKAGLSERSAVEDAPAEKGESEAPKPVGSTPATDTADIVPTGGVEPEPGTASKDSVEGKAKEKPSTAETEGIGAQGASGGASSAKVGTDSGGSDSEQTLVAGGDIYALQLIGFFSRKSVDEFVARNGLPARVYVAQRTYRGRPWYVVIHSLYDDYAAAEEALSHLSVGLLRLHPWIRPLSEVSELKIIETGPRPE